MDGLLAAMTSSLSFLPYLWEPRHNEKIENVTVTGVFKIRMRKFLNLSDLDLFNFIVKIQICNRILSSTRRRKELDLQSSGTDPRIRICNQNVTAPEHWYRKKYIQETGT